VEAMLLNMIPILRKKKLKIFQEFFYSALVMSNSVSDSGWDEQILHLEWKFEEHFVSVASLF
jgi:hypothetical protein